MATDRSSHPLGAALLAGLLLLAAAPAEQLDQAVEAQRAMAAAQPGNAGALNDLGNLLAEAGRYEEAEEAYRRAMEIAPELPQPPYNLALLLAARKQPREARRVLSRMLEQHPGHAWGHYQLGTLRQAGGHRGKALRSYREAFRLDPTLLDPQQNPHVVDNPLATAAMLEAFALAAPAATNQRIYVEPSRITGLLLPPLTATPDDGAMDGEDGAEPLEEVEVTPPPGG